MNQRIPRSVHEIRPLGRRGLWSLVILLASAAFWTSTASAGVEFVPRVSTGVAYTDNLTLSSSNPEAQTVLLLTPGFTLHQQSLRLQTDLDYQLQSFYYWGRDVGEVYNKFNGNFSFALDPDNFFLQFGAQRTQTIVNPAGRVFTSNLPISNNRTNRNSYFVGPMFQYVIGSYITARGNYRHGWLSYDYDRRFQPVYYSTDYQIDQASFSLDNYRKGHGFTWAARLNANETDYGVYKPWAYRRAGVELGFWAGENVRLFAAGGKVSAWDKPFDPSLEDNFWDAGMAIQTRRIDAEFAAGERSFGSSQRANIDFTFQHGQMHLGYSVKPTTQGRDRNNRFSRPTISMDFLNRVGRVERYVKKRLEWRLSFQLRRTDLSVTLFNESREDRFRIDGLPLPDQQQRGGNLMFKMQVGVRTSVSLRARRADWEYELGQERLVQSISLMGDYQLGQRTTASVKLRHVEQKPLDGPGRNYDANIISLLLTWKFDRNPQTP